MKRNKVAHKNRIKQKTVAGARIALSVGLMLLLMLGIISPLAWTLAPPGVSLALKQTFTPDGSATPPTDSFEYLLTGETSSAPLPSGAGGDGTYSFSVSGTASVEIGPILFASAGTYVYELKCVTNSGDGYSIDAQIYTIEIYIETDLPYTVIIKDSSGEKVPYIIFEHSYGAAATLPSDMVDPPVEKIISGTPSASSVFTFRLTAENSSNPMPEGSFGGVKTIEITGEGRGEFGTWSYAREGIYKYTVSEVNSGIRGYSYDTEVYTIVDDVRAEGGQLIISRTVTNSAAAQRDVLTFTNTYETQTTRIIGPITGGLNSPVVWIALILISGILLSLVLVYYRKRKASEGK